MTNIEKSTLVITFNTEGPLCYLSHREMATMFQRGLVRAGIEVAYSLGFNPRIRMSLPLPRTVGVECFGDVLCVGLTAQDDHDADNLRQLLAAQLPEGCTIIAAQIVRGKCSYQAQSAFYVFSLSHVLLSESVRNAIERLREVCDKGGELFVDRSSDKNRTRKRKEVGAYLSSVEVEGSELMVRCRITPGGSIRVEEIMNLLGVERSDLSGPVVRDRVEWSGISA